jgi:hypothetical protein
MFTTLPPLPLLLLLLEVTMEGVRRGSVRMMGEAKERTGTAAGLLLLLLLLLRRFTVTTRVSSPRAGSRSPLGTAV